MADVTAEQAEQVEREVRSRFPEGAIERVVLLRHGDDPAIEPGRLGVRVLIDPAGNDAPTPAQFFNPDQIGRSRFRIIFTRCEGAAEVK